MARDDARVRALGAIYAADVLDSDAVDVGEASGRVADLARGTWAHLPEIDEAISSVADRWRIDRMPAVDRSILRLATYELGYTETPTAVVISEAVELAKRYSTSRSGAFVNGVLSAIADAGFRTTRV